MSDLQSCKKFFVFRLPSVVEYWILDFLCLRSFLVAVESVRITCSVLLIVKSPKWGMFDCKMRENRPTNKPISPYRFVFSLFPRGILINSLLGEAIASLILHFVGLRLIFSHTTTAQSLDNRRTIRA